MFQMRVDIALIASIVEVGKDSVERARRRVMSGALLTSAITSKLAIAKSLPSLGLGWVSM